MKKTTQFALAGCLAGWLVACLALLPGTAEAKKQHLTSEAVFVPAGATHNEDISSKGPITIFGTVNGDVVAIGSSVTVRGTVNSHVVAVGGDALVHGTINGDLTAIGGDIDLDGTVSGDIISLGGTVALSSTTEVKGDVSAIGGMVEKPEGAVIRGDITSLNPKLGDMIKGLSVKIPGFMKELEELDVDVTVAGEKESRREKRHKKWRERREEHQERSPGQRLAHLILFLIALGGLAAIHMLATLLFCEPTRRTAKALTEDFWKAGGLGLLAAVAFMPALIFLAISIIGIPIIPLLFLLLFISVIMGLSAVSLVLSERLYPALKTPQPGIAKSVGVGFLLLNIFFIVGKLLFTLGGIFDLFGVILIMTNTMLLFAAILMGLGAIIMTRLGTRSHPTTGAVGAVSASGTAANDVPADPSSGTAANDVAVEPNLVPKEPNKE